jgi:hypothetical protein
MEQESEDKGLEWALLSELCARYFVGDSIKKWDRL